MAAALALAGLAACEDPAWRNPATSRDSADLAPPVQEAILDGLSELRPRTTAKRTIIAPMPALAPWGQDLIGKPLKGVFPRHAPCLGNLDAVRTRYLGTPEGVAVVGWAWDPDAKAAPARVLLVDDSMLIRGAGTSGAPRPNVLKAIPEVTSVHVGWEAHAPQIVGPLDAYGVLADGKTVCKLGHIDL